MEEVKYYSQFGEDKYLNENCKLPEKGVFVDVGAGGLSNSNSWFFEQKGWDCLCIEPDDRYFGLNKRKTVDRSIIGDKNRDEVDFVFHRHPQLNGLYNDKATAVKLPMFTLDTVLKNHKITNIDVLSIDVEGNEFNVLLGLSIDKHRPKYIIIEYSNQFKKNNKDEIVKYLGKYNYKMIVTTQSNLIMEAQNEKS